MGEKASKPLRFEVSPAIPKSSSMVAIEIHIGAFFPFFFFILFRIFTAEVTFCPLICCLLMKTTDLEIWIIWMQWCFQTHIRIFPRVFARTASFASPGLCNQYSHLKLLLLLPEIRSEKREIFLIFWSVWAPSLLWVLSTVCRHYRVSEASTNLSRFVFGHMENVQSERIFVNFWFRSTTKRQE